MSVATISTISYFMAEYAMFDFCNLESFSKDFHAGAEEPGEQSGPCVSLPSQKKRIHGLERSMLLEISFSY